MIIYDNIILRENLMEECVCIWCIYMKNLNFPVFHSDIQVAANYLFQLLPVLYNTGHRGTLWLGTLNLLLRLLLL